jgi:PadR family transcriptional regulator, regulatory protein PadR
LAGYLISKNRINEYMKRTYLGEFEEIVLLTVAVIDGDAYGVALMHEIIAQTGRDLRLNQVHAALMRLEEKGMVKSTMGQPTAERGGRRKKLFSVTVQGQRALQEIRQVRESLWGRLLNPFKLSVG